MGSEKRQSRESPEVLSETERLRLEREAEIRARIEEARKAREKAGSAQKEAKSWDGDGEPAVGGIAAEKTAETSRKQPASSLPPAEPFTRLEDSAGGEGTGSRPEEREAAPDLDRRTFPRKHRRKGPGILLCLLVLTFVLLSVTGAIGAPAYYETAAEDGVPSWHREEEMGRTNGVNEKDGVELAPAGKERAVLRINPEPVFYGNAEGTLHIENVSRNYWDLSVEIRLREEDRSVFRCGALKPGQYLSYARLNQELAPGEHPATAYFTLYDPVTRQPVGTAGVEIKIVIRR